jgi:hypothetical protein
MIAEARSHKIISLRCGAEKTLLPVHRNALRTLRVSQRHQATAPAPTTGRSYAFRHERTCLHHAPISLLCCIPFIHPLSIDSDRPVVVIVPLGVSSDLKLSPNNIATIAPRNKGSFVYPLLALQTSLHSLSAAHSPSRQRTSRRVATGTLDCRL